MNMNRADFDHVMRTMLGEHGWLTQSSNVAGYRRDWLGRYGEVPLGVARPASTEEVASIVSLCGQHGISISPQGGNTGLAGGSVVSHGETGIILSMSRMNRIVTVDPIDFTATVEAGVVLESLHARLADEQLMFPLHLGAEGSAQIGGLIGTNAGGSHAMRYGMMQDLVLGLEVVLPDGSILDSARALIKDNAGYQLRRLFCGAEGTLGIVTRAVLRLYPAKLTRSTALLALGNLALALQAGATIRTRAGEFLTALEFFDELGLRLVSKHVPGLRSPLDTRGPVYLLVELSTSIPGIGLDAILEDALACCLENETVLDGVIASNETQRAAFWRLREEMPEGQRLEGPQLKHDVATPVSRLAEFVASAKAAIAAVLPGVRANPFGHLGDGNVHFNLSPPEGWVDFQGHQSSLSEAVYAAAVACGGTISAEHGIGHAKISLADRYRPTAERTLMRTIKQAIDPEYLFNPRKIVER